ncbi:DeoR family transcriptional regulator [Kaistia algarum]|uniref:DeoR/GlpR family DNA-binding transcription regulator n=1 Tax=Kaistia algarum TaxID=2083279 RepID=UPI000CE7915B|nr:DeoR/GlpR family DNA-binding transcription regulator [Kaistia algarum]MCX5512458.1 DeoR/GlpR family DNA-binding transcription regulator [Kaistia algarum]PPE80536.1 DeoR family transcriptional regulator [Kaistia algarum]
MMTVERKRLLLEILKRDGRVVAKAVSGELGLSEDTIRRDLRELASEGLLTRVHGGALPASPGIVDFSGRRSIEPSGKQAIGRAAAALIEDGQVVVLDGGTTAIEVARHIRPDLRATIVTHSPSTAVELVPFAGVEVILIGGRLFKHSVVTTGADAIDSIRRIRADLYFLGVTGIHPEAGLTTGDYDEAGIKRAWMAQAAETVALASRDKIGTAAPFLVAPIGALAGIVTESDVSPDFVQMMEAQDIAVTRA